MAGTTNLAAALQILNSPLPPTAELVLDELEAEGLTFLAAADLAVTFRLQPGSIKLESAPEAAVVSSRDGITVPMRLTPDQSNLAVIAYPKQRLYVVTEALAQATPTQHDLVDLLKCAWYVEYRLDGLTLHPPETRFRNIESAASQYSMSPARLVALSGWLQPVGSATA
jgi:hypothetical protein